MSRGIAIYFGILIVLTLIALVPGAIIIGLLLFILPGLILTASPTLLYYSLAILPAYFINRIFRKRRLRLPWRSSALLPLPCCPTLSMNTC